MAYDYHLLIEDETLARTSARALEVLAGEPAYATRGPGFQTPRHRTSGYDVPSTRNGRWLVPLRECRLAHLLRDATVVHNADLDTAIPLPDRPVLADGLFGFYREYLHDFDRNLSITVVGVRQISDEDVVVRDMSDGRCSTALVADVDAQLRGHFLQHERPEDLALKLCAFLDSPYARCARLRVKAREVACNSIRERCSALIAALTSPQPLGTRPRRSGALVIG